MSHRIAGLALVFAALCLASCAELPPESQSPEPPAKNLKEVGHNCLACWGPSADAVMPLLEENSRNRLPRPPWGVGWGKRLMDQPTFDAMENLKRTLQKAVGDPVTISHKDMPGEIAQDAGLDLIRELCHKVEAGVGGSPVEIGLDGDVLTGFHVEGTGWLLTLIDPLNPPAPPVPNPIPEAKARALLTFLKEAVDM